jgi:hypothetical protein
VGGSLPGERKPPTEKGVKSPRHGLYIREDVTMTCSALLMRFVKRTFKDSHASLVEKLVERAHLLESNFANERLRALREVEPGERMAIGDIFIAPPPDYRPWGYMSPNLGSQSQKSPLPSPRLPNLPNSAPTSSPLQRTNTNPSPHHLITSHLSHSRCHSDPIPSPGLSSASTLVSESDRPATPPKDAAFKFALINPISTPAPVAAPAPKPAPAPAPAPKTLVASASQPNLYLLPSTTYNGGRPDRLISLHPAGNMHTRNQSASSILPPRISYTPTERPISFTFTNTSPFDTHSRTSRTTNPNHNLLDEIDDAIDQVFLYAASSRASIKTENTDILLPATKYEAPESKKASETKKDAFVLPALKYEAPVALLSSKKYEPEPKKQELEPKRYEPEPKKYEDDLAKQPLVLPSTTYNPQQHARKDSVVPWTDKELPPVPIDG